jgi:hypothetical protein
MGLFNCTCRYRFAQPELTLNDLKFEKDSKTEAVTKIQNAYKCYKARKLVKFIFKRKNSIADGIEIKMSWDCTNKLKIPDGFEYTQQNLAYLKKEILNFYNILFNFEIKSNTKISIKKENLLYVTKENFLEKFKTVIMLEMFKNFDLGSKKNELKRVTVDDLFNEKLLTLKYKDYAKIHTVSFLWDKESKTQIMKKASDDDEISRNEEKTYASNHSNIDDSNFIPTDRESNKLSLTTAVRKIFSMAQIHISTDKNKDKEKMTEVANENVDKGNRKDAVKKDTITSSKETTKKKKKVNFKSESFKKHKKEQSKTTNNSTPERVKYMEKKQKDNIDSDNESTGNYFSLYANSKSTIRNTNTKIYEENNSPSIEGILNDILLHTDTGGFLTFLDNEDGTFYEGTIHGYYDKQGLGIELLFDKSKGLRYKYLGYFYKNHFHGYGIIAYENGLFYKGEFRMGQRTGYGVEITNTSVYRGFFNKGKYCGYGEIKAGNEFYIGTFKIGMKEGFGFIEQEEGNSNSFRYIGGFRNNLMDGVGLLKLPGDKYYYGEFKDNIMNGRGEYKWSSGDIYVGGYLNNLKHGEGEYYLKSSHAILKGSWCNGEKINEFRLYQINENNI